MNILIYPGSFDPFHNGHISIIKAAVKQFSIDKVFIVLSKKPVGKEPFASVEDRLEMIKLSLENENSNIVIDDYEIYHTKTGYTYETVDYFKKQYKNDSLYLLIGLDQVSTFNKWKNPNIIAKQAKIIYYKRKGYYDISGNAKKYEMNLIEGTAFNVSSTEIRKAIKIESNINVLNYIVLHKLYFARQLSTILNLKRYRHCMSVANLSYEIAESNGLHDLKYQAFLAGFLHDCGKYADLSSTNNIMYKFYSEYCDLPRYAYHQFIGNYYAITMFKIREEEVLNAIKFHCTGHANMTNLEKIVYAADKIDPLRGYDSKYMIDMIKTNLTGGFIYVLSENLKFINAKKKLLGDDPLAERLEDNRLFRECVLQYLQNNMGENRNGRDNSKFDY